MDFALSKLVDWARRSCGDRQQRVREAISATGDTALVLGNEGSISLVSVTVDGAAQNLQNDLSILDNVITFNTAPAVGSNIVVIYVLTVYSNSEISDFLADAALSVASDIHTPWTISRTSYKILGIENRLLNSTQTDLHFGVQRLLVYRSALDVSGDKANQAADSAILIKNADTTVDTSKTSLMSERAMERLQDRYDKALVQLQSDLFRGTGMVNSIAQDHYPYNFPALPYQSTATPM